jgi:hypothetical protein
VVGKVVGGPQNETRHPFGVPCFLVAASGFEPPTPASRPTRGGAGVPDRSFWAEIRYAGVPGRPGRFSCGVCMMRLTEHYPGRVDAPWASAVDGDIACLLQQRLGGGLGMDD